MIKKYYNVKNYITRQLSKNTRHDFTCDSLSNTFTHSTPLIKRLNPSSVPNSISPRFKCVSNSTPLNRLNSSSDELRQLGTTGRKSRKEFSRSRLWYNIPF